MKSPHGLVLVAGSLCVMTLYGFSLPPRFGASTRICFATRASSPVSVSRTRTTQLRMSDDEDQQERLRKMGYSDEELQRASSSGTPEVPNVNVQEVEVDPITLTALGFGLIALNFLVFANMGDGGIAGIIARIQNTLNS